MDLQFNKVIVKVGKSSSIKFRGIEAFRAITIDELAVLSKTHVDASIVIIENIKEKESEQAKEFVKSFEKEKEHNKVFFYVVDNDDVTCGIADELECDIYLNLKDLYRALKINYGLVADIDLNISKELSDVSDDIFDTGIGNSDSVVEPEGAEEPVEIEDEQVESTEEPAITEEPKVEIIEEPAITEEPKVESIEEPVVTEEHKEPKVEFSGQSDKVDTVAESSASAADVELKEYIDKYNALSKLVSGLEAERDNFKAKLVLQSRIGKVALDKLKVAEEEQEATNKKIEEYKSKLEQLESKIEDAEKSKAEQAENDEFIEKLKAEIIGLTGEREKLLFSISTEVKSRLFITRMLSNAVDRLLEANGDKDKIADLTRELEHNESVIASLKLQVESFSEYENTIEKLKEDTEKRVELAKKFAEDELNKAKHESLEWRTKFEVVQNQFIAKEAQYNTIVQSVGMNESGVNSLLENSRTIEEINKTLRDQIVLLKNDLEKANKDKAFALKTAATLEETTKNMRVSMKAMSVGMTGGTGISSSIPSFNYQGRGMVIPVFGCGSFGITTTAMSIANKLSMQARVLYIDFDMVAPKADGWFKVNPIATSVPDVTPNNPKATGLGLFVDKQVEYFIQNVGALINPTAQTKNGCIDYISGFYVKPDIIKLMSADFRAFLSYCGNSYAYVIIDFGRLGSSEVNDQIIKVFSDVAYRNVVVTTSDKFEIRNFKMKLDEAKIDVSNIAWLVNMCESTKLDDKSKRAMGTTFYSLMPFNPDLYGKRLDFTKDRVTRDKLTLFLEKKILRQ